MKIVRHLVIGLMLLLLPSCGLINSALKIPLGILKTAGRTVGVSNLTDAPAQPVNDQQEQEAVEQGDSNLPVSTDIPAQ